MEKYFKSLQNKKVSVKHIHEFDATGDYEGIQAITYEGADLDGKKTKVFAYIGYPDCTAGKAPAVLLVHGGGGVPYLEWVKIWNERGYVALAMSTTNDFPKIINAGAPQQKNDAWNHGLYGIFAEDGYINAPGNDGMKNSDKDIESQWMYHALSQVIIAHNILRCDEKADKDKIGIVGVSWGGVITSLAIGCDERFAFAVPIYGSGYMTENKGSIGELFRNGKNPELWLAEKNFAKVKMPVLWLCWNKDGCFSINSNSKSFLDTVKNNEDTRLSIVNEMYHDHPWAWVRKETYAFADSVCKNNIKLPTFQKKGDRFEISNPDNLLIPFVKLYYTDEVYSYSEKFEPEQDWKIINLDFENGHLKYEVPSGAKAYYLEMTILMYTDVYIICSEFVEKDKEK